MSHTLARRKEHAGMQTRSSETNATTRTSLHNMTHATVLYLSSLVARAVNENEVTGEKV